MNRKAFISLDTVISIFLLSMIVIVTQNTNDLINRGNTILYKQRQEIEELDKLMEKIEVGNLSNYNSSWNIYEFQGKIFKIRKIYDNKNFIKIEIKPDKDNNDEKTYEKIIFK